LLETAPRETRNDPGALQRWLEGRRQAGQVSTEDLNFTPTEQMNLEYGVPQLRDPNVYENYLRDESGPFTRAMTESPFLPERRYPGAEDLPYRYVGEERYHSEDLHQPGGQNYREVVLRSPELPSYTGTHFDNIPHSDDVLGWLRMQDYNPEWTESLIRPADYPGGAAGWARRRPGRDAPAYTWIDEGQSDRMGALRQAQRNLRDMTGRNPESIWDEARANVNQAQFNLGPWGENWDHLLFRRGLQESALSGTPGMAWTSGAMQGQRYNAPASNYASLYDRSWPRLAAREARRLGGVPNAEMAMTPPRTRYDIMAPHSDTGEMGPRSTVWNAHDAEEALDNWRSNSWHGDDNLDPSKVSLRITENVSEPYYRFNWNTEDPRALLDEHGLPYFARGGLV